MNDLSLTRDKQEIEFLRLQVLEQQHVIDDLSLVRPRGCPPSGGRLTASGLQGNAADVGWGLPEPLLVMGVLLLCSARGSLDLVHTASPVPGSGFHGYSLSQVLPRYLKFATMKKQYQFLKRVSWPLQSGQDLSPSSLIVLA